MSKARKRLFCRDLINGDFLYAIRFEYTGEWTYRTIGYGNKRYRLITLLTSGVLTFLEPYIGDFWMCGAGNGGGGGGVPTYPNINYGHRTAGHGGGGGYPLQRLGVVLEGEIQVDIGKGGKGGIGSYQETGEYSTPGADGGATMFGDEVAPGGHLANGGSGGGLPRYILSSTHGHGLVTTYGGKGIGKTTVPFGDTHNFAPLCAGGAAGVLRDTQAQAPYGQWWYGQPGGSNGSDSVALGSTNGESAWYAPGGHLGGGNGINTGAAVQPGSNGSAPGAGGGGGRCTSGFGTHSGASGGDGADGVVYIRIPLDQEPKISAEITASKSVANVTVVYPSQSIKWNVSVTGGSGDYTKRFLIFRDGKFHGESDLPGTTKAMFLSIPGQYLVGIEVYDKQTQETRTVYGGEVEVVLVDQIATTKSLHVTMRSTTSYQTGSDVVTVTPTGTQVIVTGARVFGSGFYWYPTRWGDYNGYIEESYLTLIAP